MSSAHPHDFPDSAAPHPPDPAHSDALTLPPAAAAPIPSAFDEAALKSYPPLCFGDSLAPPSFEKMQVPGYEILSELGRGGMGVVYKARQTCLNRLVAIKMILADAYAGPEDQARFHREAEAVARLQHPNIVQVYEIAAHDGRPFFSLEYVEGGNLAARLNGQPMVARQAAKLLQVLARAVQATHEQGIIHRDIKPANVLLTKDGVPKITDFGLAKYQDRETGQTQSGTLVGTPSYMPPEQVRSAGAGTIGPATDVYALGAVLYELLTGRPPFLAATPLDTVLQVLSKDPTPPTQLQSRVPRDLETICLKCLAKNPARRYATAEALAEDLGRFLAGKPILARPIPFWVRGAKWARRHKAAAVLIGLGALILPAVGFQFLVHQIESREKRESEFQKLAKDYYIANVALANRLWQQNSTQQARELLENCPLNLRGWEWHYLQRSWRAHLRATHAPGGSKVVFRPDGQVIVAASVGAAIQLRDAATGNVLLGVPDAGPVMALSPDGNRLAIPFLAEATIKVWDIGGGKLLPSLAGAEQPVRELAFSADGEFLAARGANEKVTILSLQVPGAAVRLQDRHGLVGSLAWHPAGTYLASNQSDGTIRIWDRVTGKAIRTLSAPARRAVVEGIDNGNSDTPWNEIAAPLAFSPHGTQLARGWRETVEIWNEQTSELVRSLQGHGGQVNSLSFSPDGTRLVSGGSDRALILWDPATGKELLACRGHAAPLRQVTFNRQGDCLAAVDSTEVNIWDARPGAVTRLAAMDRVQSAILLPSVERLAGIEPEGRIVLLDTAARMKSRTWRAHDGLIQCIAASPDERFVASAGSDHAIKVWSTADGKETLRIDDPDSPLSALAFSGDGGCLATAGKNEYIQIWDTSNGQFVQRLPGFVSGVAALAFNARGNGVVCCSRHGKLRLWPGGIESRPLETELRGEEHVTQLAVCPDEKETCVVVTGSSGSVWFLRALVSGIITMQRNGHAGAVTALAFSPDGARLVTAGADRVLKLWDIATAQEILTLGTFDVPIAAVRFSADGNRLVAALRDGTIESWNGARAEKDENESATGRPGSSGTEAAPKKQQ